MRQALAGRVAGNGPFGRRWNSAWNGCWARRRVLLTTSCTHALELAAARASGSGPATR